MYLTEKQSKEWFEEHKNKNYYTFYCRNVEIESNWLSNREEAVEHLKTLMSGKKPNIFKYKCNNPHYIMKDDNSVEVVYSHEIISKTTLWDNVNAFFYRLFDRTKRFIKDVIYYIKKYDFEFGGSHNRTEWYCLIDHMISDLKYNIPIMLQKGHSYPPEFKHVDDWYNCLINFLLILQEYDFYQDYMMDKKCNDYYKQFGQKFIDNHNRLVNSIPYYDYSTDIDYSKTYKSQEDNWNELCEWIKKYGRNLWD
jgi:hypothetical protein